MHEFTLRVYYEDTDLGGFVYYANYLRFIERGRSEWVRECGIDQIGLKRDEDLVFVVRKLEADYLRPAYFGDILTVGTRLVTLGGARIVLDQVVLRGDEQVFAAKVVMVCVNSAGAVRIPDAVRAALAGQVGLDGGA